MKTDDWYLDYLRRLANVEGTERFGNMRIKPVEYEEENLQIHEDAKGLVFVKGLSVLPVSTPEEVLDIVQNGFKMRATHETKLNAVSSRWAFIQLSQLSLGWIQFSMERVIAGLFSYHPLLYSYTPPF